MALLRNTHAFCVGHQQDHLVLLVIRVSKGRRIVQCTLLISSTLFSGLGRYPSGVHAVQHGLYRFLFASGGWLRSALGFGFGHHSSPTKHHPLSPSAFLNPRAASYERGEWLHDAEFWEVWEGWLSVTKCQMEMVVMCKEDFPPPLTPRTRLRPATTGGNIIAAPTSM